mmetsp:Transcript_68079/g.192913  ORF Transcript_68079/g.192913 Transcript_68079/m.192913 type:complete len:221 (+) Transcript_68079:806-1468(+)
MHSARVLDCRTSSRALDAAVGRSGMVPGCSLSLSGSDSGRLGLNHDAAGAREGRSKRRLAVSAGAALGPSFSEELSSAPSVSTGDVHTTGTLPRSCNASDAASKGTEFGNRGSLLLLRMAVPSELDDLLGLLGAGGATWHAAKCLAWRCSLSWCLKMTKSRSVRSCSKAVSNSETLPGRWTSTKQSRAFSAGVLRLHRCSPMARPNCGRRALRPSCPHTA